jgi:HPt (histidine-containing phosphotransfer) domain-containing protein
MKSQSSDQSEISSPPLIDTVRFSCLSEALGSTKLTELCEVARQSITDSANNLRGNWQNGDASAAAARNAHLLAGVAANFGLAALAEMAYAIEKTCLTGGDGKDFADRFEEILTASLDAFSKTP